MLLSGPPFINSDFDWILQGGNGAKMRLAVILTNIILGNLTPVEAPRPAVLLMMARSKPILPTPYRKRLCMCVREGECWEWRGLENSKLKFRKCRRGNRSTEALVLHKKHARLLLVSNIKVTVEMIKPRI